MWVARKPKLPSTPSFSHDIATPQDTPHNTSTPRDTPTPLNSPAPREDPTPHTPLTSPDGTESKLNVSPQVSPKFAPNKSLLNASDSELSLLANLTCHRRGRHSPLKQNGNHTQSPNRDEGSQPSPTHNFSPRVEEPVTFAGVKDTTISPKSLSPLSFSFAFSLPSERDHPITSPVSSRSLAHYKYGNPATSLTSLMSPNISPTRTPPTSPTSRRSASKLVGFSSMSNFPIKSPRCIELTDTSQSTRELPTYSVGWFSFFF
jgi:hypothetical protein